MLTIIFTFVTGIMLSVFLINHFRKQELKQAELVGEDLLETARESFDVIMDKAKEQAVDFENELITKNQQDFQRLEENILKLNLSVEQNNKKMEQRKNHLRSKYKKVKSTIDRFEKNLKEKQTQYSQKKQKLVQLKSQFQEGLSQSYQLSPKTLQKEIENKLIKEDRLSWDQWLEQEEQEILNRSEKKAKKIISIALNRFIRPYCPERGLGFVQIPSEKVAKKVKANEQFLIKTVEKVCGVDIIFNETTMNLSISGFDPVRRKLALEVLQKMLSAQNINEALVQKNYEKTKKQIFKKILQDGNQICRELRLKNVSTPIRKMMGALRYRYSFTQNQYSHCAEVGHLCGLLGAELGENVERTKRAGLLHDLGKAMDHSVDGGHAVIGADFIEKNGESSDIVHAVRAHHYDEPPETPLAFLVIGGDALSGARPGARRSTVAAYMQKADQLQEIANSFEGVEDTLILSAGREVRVQVNSQKVSDIEALKLSQNISKRVEAECNYPGIIKITVVRKTQAVEVAKQFITPKS